MTQAIVERGWQPHCGQCWDPRGDAQASRRPRTSGRSVRRGAPPDRFWSRSRTIGRSSDMKWRPASRSGSREASRASSCKATSSGAPPSWTPSASATLISAPPSKYPPEAVRHYAAERWRPSLDVGRLADRDGLPRAARRHYLRAWWLGGGMRPLILAALPSAIRRSVRILRPRRARGQVPATGLSQASWQDHTRIRLAILRRFCPRRFLNDTGTLYPEPRVIQLPATTHFFRSASDRVTAICDTGAPTADQDGPRLKPDRQNGSP
jgi:hypothetical protein